MVRVAEMLLFEQRGSKPFTKHAVPQAMMHDRFCFAIGNFAVNPLAWCGFRGLNWTQRSGVAGAEHNGAAKHLP